MSAVLEYMKKNKIPLTRRNYLDLDYLGDPPPEPLDAEIESEIPDELKSKVIPINRKRRDSSGTPPGERLVEK